MTEAQIHSVALFFFYTLTDKAAAFSASTAAVHYIESRHKNSSTPPKDSLIVFGASKTWKKFSKPNKKILQINSLIDGGWIFPSDLKLEQWWQFYKNTDVQISQTLIWSHLLGFSDKSIAEGLGISEGTVRYRAGQGLKLLGSITTHSRGSL